MDLHVVFSRTVIVSFYWLVLQFISPVRFLSHWRSCVDKWASIGILVLSVGMCFCSVCFLMEWMGCFVQSCCKVLLIHMKTWLNSWACILLCKGKNRHVMNFTSNNSVIFQKMNNFYSKTLMYLKPTKQFISWQFITTNAEEKCHWSLSICG